MIRKGIGSGKLILFGEHSAIYGFPAIGTPLPFQTELCWIPETTSIEQKYGEHKANYSSSAVQTPDEVGEDRVIFLKLLRKLQSEITNPNNFETGAWSITSGIPRTGGFGSSAALCVAISRIALNKPIQGYDAQVHNLANRLETLFHGKTSGIDTGMACDNGVSAWFRSPSGDSPRDTPKRKAICVPKWHIIYGAVPRNQSTADSIRQLEHKAKKTHSISSITELGKIAADFLSVIEDNPSEGFANIASELANHAQEILTSLDLSNPALNKIFKLAIKCGANGGKLSGGGSGGAFFICAQNREAQDEVLENLPHYLAEKNISLSFPLKPLDFNSYPRGSHNT